MAINRFRRILPKLDPTVYQSQQLDYMPDLTGVDALVSGLQAAYDTSLSFPIPQHIQPVDTQAVREQYIEPIQQMRESATQAFMQQKTGEGLRQLSNIQRFVRDAKQPGGVYSQFESNYAQHKAYLESLAKMHEAGKINADKKEALERLSMRRFQGTFDPQGMFNPFSGISAAEDVSLAEYADKLAKGWEADKLAKGIVKVINGQYYDAVTQEVINPQEVYDHVVRNLLSDPKNLAFMRQEAEIRGLTGEEAETYIKRLASTAAEFAANKYGSTKYDHTYLKNWALQDQLAHAREMEKEAFLSGQKNSPAFNIDTGAQKLKLSEAGRIEIGRKKDIPIAAAAGGAKDDFYTQSLLFPGKKARGVTEEAGTIPIYSEEPLDRWVQRPEVKQKHPMLDEVVAANPRKRDGMKLESKEDYNRRIADIYNNALDDLTTKYLQYTPFASEKQQTEVTKRVLGQGNSIGDIESMEIEILAPGVPPRLVNLGNFMKEIGAESWEEVIDRSRILGEIGPDNPIAPSGYKMASHNGAKGKKFRTFNVIISNTTENEAKYNRVAHNLMKPKYDLHTRETPFEAWNPDGQGNMFIRTKGKAVFRDDGSFDSIVPEFYKLPVGEDDEGNPTLLDDKGRIITDFNVNEKGFLLDIDGNVIQGQKMEDLDEVRFLEIVDQMNPFKNPKK